MTDLKSLLEDAKKLNAKDKQFLINELLNRTFNFTELKEIQINNNGINCPHCSSDNIIGHGKDRGKNRFMCKDCKKTFNPFTGTSIGGIHKKNLWYDYIKLMIEGTSIRKSATSVGISLKTSFDWRHKILSAIGTDTRFEGIVESDETFFNESQKGSRKLNRKSRKRGGGKGGKRGVSNDKVAVVVSADRKGTVDMVRSNIGRMKITDLKEVFRGKLTKDCTLVTDSHPTYKGFANWRGLEHKTVHANKRVFVTEKIYHVQNVNNLHSRLKGWINGNFKGVATKYLHNYLSWFMLIEKLKTSQNQLENFFGEVINSNESIKNYEGIELKYSKLYVNI